MLKAAGRRIMVADSSKLGVIEMAPICDLAGIDLLITGEQADPDTVKALRERGLEIQLA
jgi:DeoR family transcriptional regulator, aga operon transcriptional repressor